MHDAAYPERSGRKRRGKIMSGFTEAKFNAGEVLFNAGDPAKELFILQKGEI